MKKTDKHKNELNEPAIPYKRNLQIKIFHSFEEMNEDDIQEMAATSVNDRIKNTVALILRVYGITQDQLNAKQKNNKIDIISQ